MNISVPARKYPCHVSTNCQADLACYAMEVIYHACDVLFDCDTLMTCFIYAPPEYECSILFDCDVLMECYIPEVPIVPEEDNFIPLYVSAF